jgi:hypothetical protein
MLLKFDGDIAAQHKAAGCPYCGGRLDSARYARKPRGVSFKLPDGYQWRFSFCCDREGCRRRHTPPSLRFLGRRVYLGAIVVLASAMQQGVTPVRAKRLRELFGASLQTLARWRQWWREAFVESDFWKVAKAYFSPAADEDGFPVTLLERFRGDEEERLIALIRFIGPLTTSKGYVPDRRF